MSNLILNEQAVAFKEFPGRNNEQMPKLISEGRTPLSVAGLMKRRLEVLASDSGAIKEAWRDNYFDTGDGIFYHPEGNVKVVLSAQPIRDLTLKTSLSQGAVILGENVDASVAAYETLEGAEFTRSELEDHVGNLLTKNQAKANPLWKAFVGGDQLLLNEYVDMAFEEGSQRFGHEKLMGVYLSSPQEVAVGRLLVVGSVGDNFSIADGGSNLDNGCGRLVGVGDGVASAGGADARKNMMYASNPKVITEGVFKYLSALKGTDRITKKGLLEAVKDCYQKK